MFCWKEGVAWERFGEALYKPASFYISTRSVADTPFNPNQPAVVLVSLEVASRDAGTEIIID